ncbi:hypothetical protein DE146DRAFT_621556 [Phaeosphaeria sp. MPI-PUGE-AT-0046c]|nr:hypothetical protein DE146DRAFT_621556 [Phaeosphaeria sp. MPI-PUGE-AT-0046c]
MGDSIVIVTQIEYVTVYPTKQDSIAIISQTGPGTSLGVPSTTTASTPQPITSVLMESSITHSSKTGLPSLPSGWPAPKTSSENKPWNDSLAKLALSAVVLMAVVLLSLISYAIYQRFRGKCHKCPVNEEKLRKWESGELKRITKDMVKIREKYNSQTSGSAAAPAASDVDLEAASVVQETSLFERAKGALKTKGKQRSDSPKDFERVLPSYDLSQDRFFAVVEPFAQPAQQPQVAKQYESNNYLDRAYDPLSALPPKLPRSIYSYDGENTFHNHTYSIQSEAHFAAGLPLRGNSPVESSVVSSALHIYDGRHRKAVRDVNTIEAQMRTKRRSQTYGGLPNPEGFEDIGLGNGRC